MIKINCWCKRKDLTSIFILALIFLPFSLFPSLAAESSKESQPTDMSQEHRGNRADSVAVGSTNIQVNIRINKARIAGIAAAVITTATIVTDSSEETTASPSKQQ